MVLLIYWILGYWAVNKVLYEGKVLIYGSAFNLFMKKLVYAFFLGFILIPIAIIKLIFFRR